MLSGPPSLGRSLYLGTHTDPRHTWWMSRDTESGCSHIKNCICVQVERKETQVGRHERRLHSSDKERPWYTLHVTADDRLCDLMHVLFWWISGYQTLTVANRWQPSPLTVGGSLNFPLLPRRLHWSSDSEQLSDLQAAAFLLGLSQFLQLSHWVEASLSPIAAFSLHYTWQIQDVTWGWW